MIQKEKEMDSYLLKVVAANEEDYDRAKALKAFDDTKAGVKGLVDAGITTVPQIFVTPPEELFYHEENLSLSHIKIPVIDLEDVEKNHVRRKEIVQQIRYASETGGFFQIRNHGIPQDVMKEMIEGIRRFNEQPTEMKMQFYSREKEKKVRFNSNFDLYKTKAANWRDTLACIMAPNPPSPEEFPAACREILLEYSDHARRLGELLFQLLSEALGLSPNHLMNLGCAEGHAFFCQYYPACPEPDRTLGHARHCDPDFVTILLQDENGGLQIKYENHWVAVPPVAGALVVNIGDLLQLISNDTLKSAEHRVVLGNWKEPRISVACFFTTHFEPSHKLYGPIKELVSDGNPPLYKETTIKNYIDHLNKKGLDGITALAAFRL